MSGFRDLRLMLTVILCFASMGCANGIGLRERPNTFRIACEHQIAYLSAVDGRADQQTVEKSVARLRTDAEQEPYPDTKALFIKVADAAQRGDPGPARNNVELNCQSTLRDLRSS